MNLKDFFWKMRNAVLGKTLPNLYIFLDLPKEIAEKRLSSRDEQNHFDKRSFDFKNRVHKGYLKFLSKVPHVVIDASGTPEEVFEKIIKEIKKFKI